MIYTGAKLMGLPHIGSAYTGRWRKDKRLGYVRIAKVCQVCECARSTSTHHIIPIGMGGRQSGRSITVNVDYCRAYDQRFGVDVDYPRTSYDVYTPLIALCGSGTQGCHGEFEDGVLEAIWVWDDELCRDLWEAGWMLFHGYAPNDGRLFEFGHYEIMRSGEVSKAVKPWN